VSQLDYRWDQQILTSGALLLRWPSSPLSALSTTSQVIVIVDWDANVGPFPVTTAPETFFKCLEQSAKVLSRSNGLSQTSDALVSSRQPRRPELLPWSTPLPNSNSPLHMELQCGMSPHAAYLVLLGRCTDFYPAHMQRMMQSRRAAMIARCMAAWVMGSITILSYQLLKCTLPLRSNLTTIQAPSPINLPS
jgi:hypothetical protein